VTVSLGTSGHPGRLGARAVLLASVLAALTLPAAAPQALAAPTCSVTMLEPNLGPNEWEVEHGETAVISFSCPGASAVGVEQGPGIGTLEVVPPVSPGHVMVEYTAPGVGGTDSIQFKGSDASEATLITVTLELVPPVNEAPRCNVLFLSLPTPPPGGRWQLEAGDFYGPAMFCHDDEGDELRYHVVAQPAGDLLGSFERIEAGLEGSLAHFSYQSDAAALGNRSFTVKANDGQHDSNDVVVLIELTAGVDEAPVCGGPFPFRTEPGQPLLLPSLKVLCRDPENDDLEFLLIDPPGGGHLTEPDASGGRSYVPNPDFAGTDSFTFRASDGTNQSGEAVVTIDVGTVNRPPTCVGNSLVTERDDALEMVPGCTDPDGDDLTLSLDTPPANGVIVGPDGQGHFWYLREPGFTGPVDFTYKANDGTHDSNIAAVTIDVIDASGARPACRVSNASVEQGWTLAGTLACAGAAVSYSPVAEPLHGTLTGPDAAGRFSYVPDAGYTGPDYFVYRASAGSSVTESGVLIEVRAADPSGRQTVSGDLPSGGTIATGAEATATDPLVASLTTPNGGSVSVAEGASTGGAPAGYSFVGQSVQITAPDATAQDPLTLTFTLDAGSLPAGVDETNLQVFRDGALVPDCDGGSGGSANPDPCVAARGRVADGDVRLTVLTSRASTWNFGRSMPPIIEPVIVTPQGTQTGTAGSPQTGTTGAGPKKSPCAGLTGRSLARCKVEQQIARQCGKLRRAKRKLCAKRIRALARCNSIKARTPKQRQRKALCVRKARAIGRRRS
jgi:Bacterial Ig domain